MKELMLSVLVRNLDGRYEDKLRAHCLPFALITDHGRYTFRERDEVEAFILGYDCGFDRGCEVCE